MQTTQRVIRSSPGRVKEPLEISTEARSRSCNSLHVLEDSLTVLWFHYIEVSKLRTASEVPQRDLKQTSVNAGAAISQRASRTQLQDLGTQPRRIRIVWRTSCLDYNLHQIKFSFERT
jgi:hypothetical protein